MLQIKILQKRAGHVDADQRNAIVVEFLKRLDAPSAAAFSLRRVDDLPRLIVFLLETVAGFGKVEDDGNEHAKAFEIFKNVEKGPPAQRKGDPCENPLERPEWCCPNMLYALPAHRPRIGLLSVNSHFHRGEFTVASLKLKASGKAVGVAGNFIPKACKWFQKAAQKNEKKSSGGNGKAGVQAPKDKTSHFANRSLRPSFVAQRDDGVDAGGATSWYRTSRPGDQEKAESDGRKRKPVARAYAVK